VKTSSWHFYVLLCADGSYYAGVTTDLRRRLHEHNNTARAAKYTRGRRPVKLVATRAYQTRSRAQKAEHRFKALTRQEKEAVINESR
jgi:putative endonuclease